MRVNSAPFPGLPALLALGIAGVVTATLSDAVGGSDIASATQAGGLSLPPLPHAALTLAMVTAVGGMVAVAVVIHR